MNKVYLIITNWNYMEEDGINIKVAKSFEKAKAIFKEEKRAEGITREMQEYDESDVFISGTDTTYWATDDDGNYINIYIEEKEIEE